MAEMSGIDRQNSAGAVRARDKSRRVTIQTLKNKAVLAEKCIVAERFLERLVGLIGRATLNAGEGMFFPRCNNIHMWFMRMPIDVVFIRRAGDRWEVSSVRENVRPWKLLPVADFRATETLELPLGTIQRCGVSAGDEVCIN
ncbi:MAG: DUF192 domain-containing protein [Bacteriovoracia bacterium]